MDVKWHIAFCNVTYTEYAGVTYRDYHSSPAIMLETQLQAKAVAERRWGVGRFCHPGIDLPHCTLHALWGMGYVTPEADELPYLDTTRPVITRPSDVDALPRRDPREALAKRYEFYEYYHAHGHKVGFGGAGGAVITLACELSNSAVFEWLLDDPEGAQQVLDNVMDTEERLAAFGAELAGAPFSGFGYTGDDYAGLMSPAMFRKWAVPAYRRLYRDNQSRFMHSELLRAEHLRICRDEVGITEFHGAGCKLLTLEEMYDIMGENFWTQITPQELLEWSPAQLAERIKEYANCGCRYVQLYPGRQTPDANMAAAIAACQQECAGGPV